MLWLEDLFNSVTSVNFYGGLSIDYSSPGVEYHVCSGRNIFDRTSLCTDSFECHDLSTFYLHQNRRAIGNSYLERSDIESKNVVETVSYGWNTNAYEQESDHPIREIFE